MVVMGYTGQPSLLRELDMWRAEQGDTRGESSGRYEPCSTMVKISINNDVSSLCKGARTRLVHAASGLRKPTKDIQMVVEEI